MALSDDVRAFCRMCLVKNDLLGVIDENALDRLLGPARWFAAQPGQTIFQKDDPGSDLYIILSGTVKIVTYSQDGKEVILNLMEKGAILGEIAFLDGGERTASAVAQDNCQLAAIPRSSFHELMRSHPAVIVPLVEVLCARLRWISEAYEDILFHSLPQRLARKLLILADQSGASQDNGVVKISQLDLANTLGVSREKINRQLNAWQSRQVLSLKRGSIILHDQEFLHRMVDQD
ncbi:MAG: Crp/Fnr family transcriptional regulator [Pseudomonadota bacterium]